MTNQYDERNAENHDKRKLVLRLRAEKERYLMENGKKPIHAQIHKFPEDAVNMFVPFKSMRRFTVVLPFPVLDEKVNEWIRKHEKELLDI